MKLSVKTVNLLKNFATINPSIVVKAGNVLQTMSPSKTVVAKATVNDTFPVDFCIYDLGRFISTMSLLSEPVIDFGLNSCRIIDSTNSIVYHYADKSGIVVPPDKDIKLPDSIVTVTVGSRTIQSVVKALGILGLDQIAFVGDGQNISLQVLHSKKATADTYSANIGTTDKTFCAIFKPDNIKIVDDNYSVEISSKGLSRFVGSEATYWIAVEANSQF